MPGIKGLKLELFNRLIFYLDLLSCIICFLFFVSVCEKCV